MKNYQEVTRELMVVERAAWWNPRVRRILEAAPLVVMFLLLNTRSARAACSFNPSPDPTADGSSNSLRHAIQMANASSEDCLIQLQAGTYTLTITNTSGQDNTAAQGDLDITASGHTVTILGKGAGVSIVNGNGIDRVFQVLGGANAAFSKLTIEGGIARDDGTSSALPGSTVAEGGGVLVQGGGRVILSRVSLQENQAIGGSGGNGAPGAQGAPGELAAGGGLFLSTGTVDLNDSKMAGNAATGGGGGAGGGFGTTGPFGVGGAGGTGAGGGLYVLSGSAGLFRCIASSNHATGGAGGQPALSGSGFKRNGGGSGGAGQGAGLFVGAGALRLMQTTVSGNSAAGGGGQGAHVGAGSGGSSQGAGIFAGGAISLSHTTVSGNSATGGVGGGVSANTRNTASGGSSQGAGMFVANGNISLANSTLFANTATGGPGGAAGSFTGSFGHGAGGNAAGGGLYLNSGNLALTGATLASNRAVTAVEPAPTGSSSGGGIANVGATSLVSNTTLVGNNTQDSGNANNGDDVSGAITSSFSLIGQSAGAMITDDGGNIFNVNPALDPGGLKLNGGPTQTVALESSSPAIDKGDNAVCAAPAPNGLAKVDQRGFARFLPGDNLCDIGAFEFTNLLIRPSLEFYGLVAVGQQTPYRTVSVTNNQTTTVSLTAILGGTDPAEFIEKDNCGASLAPNTRCTISIAFKPAATGKRTALLTVSDSPDRTSPYQITLIGIGK